jgi:hypothetical protein
MPLVGCSGEPDRVAEKQNRRRTFQRAWSRRGNQMRGERAGLRAAHGSPALPPLTRHGQWRIVGVFPTRCIYDSPTGISSAAPLYYD